MMFSPIDRMRDVLREAINDEIRDVDKYRRIADELRALGYDFYADIIDEIIARDEERHQKLLYEIMIRL